jgi:hypothetical protein
MIIVNILANALPINGQNTGEISDRFKVFFVPSGYVFAIWGLIYVLLLAYTVYQLLPRNRENKSLDKIVWPVVIGSLANIVWIFLWHYNHPVWCVLPMLVLLGSLIYTYVVLGIGKIQVSKGMKYAVHLTFSVYLGWITVATIANITDALFAKNWNGFGIDGAIWAALLIIIAGILASIVMFTRRDLAYCLVIVWALVGIAAKFPNLNIIIGSVAISLIIILMTTLFRFLRKENVDEVKEG